jgi:hypothetical protein
LSQRQLYEQLRRAFSALTRPPRPQLTERIRDSLWGRGRPVATSVLPVPPAALVAALVLVALVAGAVLEGPTLVGSVNRGLSGAARLLAPPRTAATRTPTTTTPHRAPAASPSPTPLATPSPTPQPTETPTPTALPGATLPGFSCSAQSGGGGQSSMTTARVGAQTGYDRFVVQFSGGVPRYEVQLQDSASFAQGGGSVTLQGSAGLAVVLHDASGDGVFTGPTDVQPGFMVIREAKLLSDSQGVVEWGIGIARPACFHAWALTGPSRLVVDIAD